MTTTQGVTLNDEADVLEAAARHIETYGWIKGQYVDRVTGACCMIGAVESVVPGIGGLRHGALTGLEKSLRLDYGTSVISNVNDQIMTRKWQALSALRRAAKRLRGQSVRPLTRLG